MKRLASALLCDVRLQARNGFYYAATFVAVCYIIVMWQFAPTHLAWLLPVVVLSNLSINTFYFIAGLVLLEKGEGTLTALVVTPLRHWEYLASKVLTLTVLSLAENVLIVAIGFGLSFDLAPLLLGLILASGLLALTGFILVSRYDSINEYLFPSALYSLAFVPPFLDYLGLWRSWLVYLHPLQAPLLLFKAAFFPIEVWQWIYGVIYAVIWVLILLALSLRAFNRFVTAAEGV